MKIRDFMTKNKKKISINFDEKNMNQIFNNSRTTFRKSFVIFKHDKFTKFSTFLKQRWLSKFISLLSHDNVFERRRFETMKLNEHDKNHMSNNNLKWFDIKIFDEIDTYVEFKNWIRFAKNKFHVESRNFVTFRLKINYVFRYCAEIAKVTIRKRVNSNSFNVYEFVKELFNDLTINFDHKNDEKSIILQLKIFFTKQRNDEFFVEFATKIFNIFDDTQYNDTIKIFELQNHMNYKLKVLIFNIDTSNTYREYVNKFIEINNNGIDLKYATNKYKRTKKRKSNSNQNHIAISSTKISIRVHFFQKINKL